MSLDIVSTYRSQIYGFAAIWVVLSHGINFDWLNFSQFGVVGRYIARAFEFGNLGVDIFLFLSGISLYFSWHKNKDLNRYIRRRLERILPAFILVVWPCCAVKYLLLVPNLHYFIGNITTIGFWIEGMRWGCWYVPGVLFFYAIYPFIYSFLFEKEKHIYIRFGILVCFVYYLWWAFGTYNQGYYWVIEIVLGRIPIFITGSLFGKFVYEKKEVSFIYLFVFITLAIFGIWSSDHIFNNTWYFRGGYIFAGIGLSYLLAFLFKVIDEAKNNICSSISAFYAKVGGVSFELYLTHVMVNRLLVPCPWWVWVLMMILSLLLSFYVRRICIYITKKYCTKF